ncbi:MAG TPA: hypothetical protein VFM38_09290 [Candidatus Limnocylindrales bacterium]|nr:hypothetical protein [Candidatus Limnocylindrales bacterium]
MADHRARPLAGSGSRRWLILAFVLGSLIVGALAPTIASARTSPIAWHRLNVAADPPEHERFGCLAGGDQWTCRYDKVPGPGLSWDQTRGTFSGEDTTADWTCPAWFPKDACDAADTVVTGVGSFRFPRASGGFSVDQQLLIGDHGQLWIYWIDQFVCPWYPTFDEALVSDASCTFM